MLLAKLVVAFVAILQWLVAVGGGGGGTIGDVLHSITLGYCFCPGTSLEKRVLLL